MKIPLSYRKPLAIAVGLHIVLLIILIIKLPSLSYEYNSGGAQTKIVQATAVSSAQVQQAMKAIQNREDAKAQQEQKRLADLRHQADVQKQQQVAAAANLAKIKAEQVAALAALKQQQLVAKQQAAMAAANAAKSAATAAKQQQQKLVAAEQQLQQQLLSQQLAGDASKVNQQIQTTQMNGIVDKYKALIISAIGQQWLVPDGTDPGLSCVYEIHLAPGGVVLSVNLVKSSGNQALDQSAQTAIYKASPLPVPQNPNEFESFRDISLTVSPKQINSQS